MKNINFAFLFFVAFSHFLFAAIPNSICTCLYKNENGVQLISSNCGKTFQKVLTPKPKDYLVVNWAKNTRILQSLDTGRTWLVLKQMHEIEKEDNTFATVAEITSEKVVIQTEENGEGIITITYLYGRVLYKEPILLAKGKNELKLPFQLSRNGLYLGFIGIRGGTTIFFNLFNK